MRTFVFLTFPLAVVGGGQCYLAAKAKYLEEQGWNVVVIPTDYSKKVSCPIKYLNKYLKNATPELGKQIFNLLPFIVEKTLRRLMRLVGPVSGNGEIIIESHTDSAALWGEVLAERIKARHVYIALYEHYRFPEMNFLQKMDFYSFKMDRGELLCSYRTANRLFEGFRQYNKGDFEAVMINEEPVQDVINPKVDLLPRKDYNICYIGRMHKGYVPHIINGIGEFASKHINKEVHFVVVGESEEQREKIDKLKRDNKNVIVTELGKLHPLPKSLYSKIDVVIAGSGSARCSVEEGALTVIADTESDKALGILGYDTNDSVFKASDSVITTYCEALERVLVRQEYKRMKYKYPPKMGVAECTKQNFELISHASQEKKYYNEQLLREGPIDVRVHISMALCYLKAVLK